MGRPLVVSASKLVLSSCHADSTQNQSAFHSRHTFIASLCFNPDAMTIAANRSILPCVYCCLFAFHPVLAEQSRSEEVLGLPRLIIMAVLSVLWGARLTFNFARKGMCRGSA